VSILVTQSDGGVRAVVEDDGQGFSPGEVRVDALGLVGMRERLALLGGTLSVESEPGAGTAVVADIPLTAVDNG
jgi:signal transduction histidine kinase